MSSIIKTDKILDTQGNVVADANSIGWALGENFTWTDHTHLNQIVQTKIEVIDVDAKITTSKDQSAGTPVAGIPDELFRTTTGLLTLSNSNNYVLVHVSFVPTINSLKTSSSTGGASGRFFISEGASVEEVYRLEQDLLSSTVYTDAGSHSSTQHSPGVPVGFVDVPANKQTTHRYPPVTISLLDKQSLSLTPTYHLHGICGTTSGTTDNEIGIAENSQIIITLMEIDRSPSVSGAFVDGVFVFSEVITQDVYTGYDLKARMSLYGWDGTTKVSAKIIVAEDTYVIAPKVDQYAITVDSLPGGSAVDITVRGHVWGHGGAGAVPIHDIMAPQGMGPNWSVNPYDTREWDFLNNPNEPVTGGLYAYFGNFVGWKKELSRFDRGTNKNSNGYFGPGHVGQSGGSAIYLGSPNITVRGQHKVLGGGGGGAATSGAMWNNNGIFGGGGQPFGLSANGDGVMPHSTTTPNPNFYWTGELSSGWHPPLFTSGTWYPESDGSWGSAGSYTSQYTLGPWWGGTATRDAPGAGGYWSGFGGISAGAGGAVGQQGGTGFNYSGWSEPGPAGIAYTKKSGIDYTIDTDENILVTVVSGVPFQPTNLQTANTNGNIRLFWNTSDGAVTYKVIIGTDSLFTNPTIITGITDVFYDHAVTNWIPYWYKVVAVNDVGDSIESEVTTSHGFNFTGGQEVEYTKNDLVWKGHAFSYDPTITNTFTIDNSWNFDILLVAGGGGGGGFGGGGGGGGVAPISGIRLNPGTYTMTLGQGGAAGTSASNGVTTKGSNGQNTIFEGPIVTDTITGIHQLTPTVQLLMQNHDNVSTKNYYDGNQVSITNVVGTTELNSNSYYVKNVAQVVTTDTIDAVVQLTPGVQLTVNAHPFADADPIVVTGVVGTTELNDNTYYVKKINDNTIDLYTDAGLTTALDGSSFTAYTSGGTLTKTIPNRLELYTDEQFYFPVDGSSYTAYTSGGTTTMQIRFEALGGAGGGSKDVPDGSHNADWDGLNGGNGGGGAGAPFTPTGPANDTYYHPNVLNGAGGISTQFSTYNYGLGFPGGKGFFPDAGGGGGGAGGAGSDAYVQENAANGDPVVNGSSTQYARHYGGNGGAPLVNDWASGTDLEYSPGGGGCSGTMMYDDVTIGGYNYFYDGSYPGSSYPPSSQSGRGGTDTTSRWNPEPSCTDAGNAALPGGGGGGAYWPCSAGTGMAGALIIRYAKPTGKIPATPTGLSVLASATYPGAMEATWNAVSGAEEYEIEFSQSAYMRDSKVIRITGQYTDVIPANLFENLKWYWFRIRSKNIIGTSEWSGLSAPSLVRPRGGDHEILYVVNGQSYYGHTFTSDGTFVLPFGITADVFMVGGGGGGGIARGGGGGAGGLVHETSYSMSTANIPVTVGTGGAGANPNLDENDTLYSSFREHNRFPQDPQRGGDTKLGTLLTAMGGGGGGNMFYDHTSTPAGTGSQHESAQPWIQYKSNQGSKTAEDGFTYVMADGQHGGCGGGGAGGGRKTYTAGGSWNESDAYGAANLQSYILNNWWLWPPWRGEPGNSIQNSTMGYGTGFDGAQGIPVKWYTSNVFTTYLKIRHEAEAAGGGGGIGGPGTQGYWSLPSVVGAPYNGHAGHGGSGGPGLTNTYRDGVTRYYGGGGGGSSGALAPYRWGNNTYPNLAWPGTVHAWGGTGSEGDETSTFGGGHGGSVGNAVTIWGVAYRRTPGAGRDGSGSGGGGASSEPGRQLVTGYTNYSGDNTQHGGAGGSGTVIIRYEVPAEPDAFAPSQLPVTVSDRGHYILISFPQAFQGESVDYYNLYKGTTFNPSTVDQTIDNPSSVDGTMTINVPGSPGDYVYFGISSVNDSGTEGPITYFEHQYATNFNLEQPATFTATEFTTTDGQGNTILGIRLDWSTVPFVTNYEITLHDNTTVLLDGSTTNSEVLLYQDFTAWYGDTFTYKIRTVDSDNSSFSQFKTVDITTSAEQTLALSITSDTTNYNLQTEAISAGWVLTKQGELTLNIDAGVTVYSTTDAPAIVLGQDLAVFNWTKGTKITINNSGTILGGPGSSGSGNSISGQPGYDGGAGGTAIHYDYSSLDGSDLTVNNLTGGIIKGGGGGGGGGGAGNNTAGWGIWSSWQLSNEQDPDNTDTLYGFTFSIYNYWTAHYGNMQDKSGYIRWNGTTLGRLTQWMNSNFQNNPGDFWERVCSASISQDGSQGWDGRSNYYSNTLDNSAYGSSGPGTGEFYEFTSSQYQYQVDRNNTTSYSQGSGYDIFNPYRSILRYAIRRRGATTVSAGTGGDGGSGMGHNIALTNGTTGTDGNDNTTNGNDQAGNGGNGGYIGFPGTAGTDGSGGAAGGAAGIAGYIIKGNSGTNNNISQITFNDTGSKVIGTQYDDTYVNTAWGAWSGWGSDGIDGDNSVWWFAIHREAFPVDGNGNIIHNSSVTNIGEILTQNVYGDTNLPASIVQMNPTGITVTINMQTIYPLMTLTYTSPFLINDVEYEFEAENGAIPGTNSTFHTVPHGNGTRIYHYFKARRRSNTSYT